MSYRQTEWVHRLLQFILGAIVGAVIGLYLWTDYADSWLAGWICIGGGAVGLGTVAAIAGDELWKNLRDYWRW